jgi:hypothetical protein
MWWIFGFKLCENHPSVLAMPLHLPNMQMFTFKAGENLNDVAARENQSMLTEYFLANKKHVWAQDILYKDFPRSFTWQPAKYWKKRDRGQQVGRIVSAHPAEGERYFLRVLLNHVPGSNSFKDLKIVDGVLCDSFREAAERKGLVKADNTLDESLMESEQYAMPASLRRLFAMILVFCEPGDVHGFWNRHIEAMSDDY